MQGSSKGTADARMRPEGCFASRSTTTGGMREDHVDGYARIFDCPGCCLRKGASNRVDKRLVLVGAWHVSDMTLLSAGLQRKTSVEDLSISGCVSRYLAGLFGLLAGNAILYVTVSVMDPGALPLAAAGCKQS